MLVVSRKRTREKERNLEGEKEKEIGVCAVCVIALRVSREGHGVPFGEFSRFKRQSNSSVVVSALT